MEVAEVSSTDLGPGPVVVGADELQYELTQQAGSFLANAHITTQGSIAEGNGAMLTLPIQFVQLHDPGGDSGVNRSEVTSTTASGLSGHIIIKNGTDGCRSIILDPNEVFSKLSIGGEDGGDSRVVPLQDLSEVGVGSSLSDLQERGLVQLDENVMAQVSSDIAQNGVVLAGGGDYITQKDGAIPQFASFSFVDGQVVLTTTETGVDDTVTLEGGNLIHPALSAAESVILPGPVPISIKKEPDVDPPVGKGPFTCEYCKLTIDKWPQYNKHLKKHLEDKPFQCFACEASFNIEKNLKLHEALHNSEKLECPECSKTFRRLASFKAHLVIHEEDESVSCEICQEEFVSIKQLEPHIHSHSASGMEEQKKLNLECRECGAEFSTEALLTHHLKAHKKVKKMTAAKPRKKIADRSKFDNKCMECGKHFIKPSQLQRHLRIHTGERPFKCLYPGCDRAFNQKYTMLIHMDIHTGNKAFKCEFCNKEFVQKSNLRCHIKRVHPVNKTGQELFECEECSCIFRRAGSLNAHISRAHTNETVFSTDLPSDVRDVIKEIQDLQKLGQQPQNGTPMYKNKPKSATSQQQDGQLKRKNNGSGVSNTANTSTSENTNPGDILQQALKNIGLPQSKDQTVHGTKAKVNPEDQSTPEDNNWTPEDGDSSRFKDYRKVRLLNLIDRSHDNGVKKHTVLVRMVGDVKWHMCVYKDCTKEFKKPSDLVRHMRIHTNDKPFKCTKCFRAFGVKSTLMAHMKTHLALKEHACDKCDKTFTTSTSLRVHSWLHTGQKPYPCPLCNKVFRTASHRKNHMLSHQHSPHRQAQRRRSIPLPDIPLQEPIRITTEGPVKQSPRYSQIYPNETGEVAPDRPHKCHMCPAAFKKSSHLKQHVRTHTGERPYKCDNCDKQFNSRSVLRSHYKTHTGQRNHACHLCGGLFASSSSLKRHETTHSADRPYMCPYCQKTFKTNTNCKKHMKTHKHELAMEAVRAAGSSLQGDNQQALLTASLYSQQAATPSLSDNEVIVSDLGGMTSVFPDGEFHITGHLQQQSQHQQQQHQEDLTGTQVLPAAFAQGVTENGLTLADLQTEVEHGLASGDTVILASQPTGITTHLGGSSVLLPHPGEGHEARGTTILLPHSSSNRVTNASSLLQGTNSSSILLPDSSSNQRSHSSVSGQEDAGATLIALPHSTDGRVVTVHQPSVIQGPAREDSANVTSVIQPQPSIINQSQSSNYSGRQALLDPAHTFSNPLGENGTLEMVTIPTSMITGNSQNSYTSQVIQANLHIEGSRESDITSTTNPTNAVADEANLGRAVSSAPESDTHNVMETDNVCVITGHGSTDPSANNDSSTTLLEANFDHQGFSEGFTLQVPPGLDLSTLGQGGEIPATQLAQLLNSQVSVPEESPMKVTSSIPSSEPQTKEQDPPEPVVSVSMLYECNECNRTFRKLSNLRSHRRIHSQAKTYCCSTCNKNWSTQDLKAHQQQQAHSSPQSNRCGNCSLIFPSLGQLLKHMQGDHASVWQCPECEDVFDNSPSYQKPRQQNDSAANQHASKNKETPGTAANEEVCVKRDTDIVIVDEHVEDKNADTFEEDPLQNTKATDLEESDQQRHAHQCKNCSKSFKKPSDLVRHIRTHTGERPYSCALCGKSFAVKSTLDVHMKTHSGKKDFMCHICNTMFATKGSLNIHMRLHTGAKPFKCSQCDLKFRTSGHRKAHVLKHLKAPQTLVKVDNAKTPQIEEPMEVSDTAMDNVMEIPNVDGLNSVVMLPDGTMSLQLQGLNIVGAIDASALLNIQPVTLDESVLNQLQASEVTMMATGEGGVDEDAEDSISVNPNVVMTHPRSIRTSGSNESLEESDLEIHMVDGDGRVITTHTLNMINQQLSRESATTPETSYITQEISLSDLAVPLHNNTLQCALCSKTFVKLSDWQMHLMVHNIFLKVDDEECETDIQNSEVVPPSLNEVSDNNFSATQAVNASALTVEGMTVSKLEESASTHVKCAVPRCGRTFESQTSLDQHIINTHMKQHECSKCEGQVFTSAAALQKHIKTQHNDSKGVRCIFCSEKFSLRGSLHQHIVQEHLQLAIDNPVLTEKLGLRINFTPESQRTQGNIEELDPLELFPSVN